VSGEPEDSRSQPTAAGEPETYRGSAAQRRFEQVLTWSRLLVLIPVVFLLLDAAGSFIYGADILLRSAAGLIGEPKHVGGRLGQFLIVMDSFLVGATLMIAAFGLYELFVLRNGHAGKRYWLPSWLRMNDLEDLKARVVSMLILVAAITFVDIAVESHDEQGILFIGLGISAVILALTAFLRYGRHGTGAPVAPAPAPAAPAPGPAPAPAQSDQPAAADQQQPGAAP
jgi:uncharacterized membrane protein YqhA